MNEIDDTILNNEFIDSSNDIYTLKTVDIDDIIKDLKLSDEDEIITRSIILGIEYNAADTISNNLIASLPYVGTLQKDITKDLLQEHSEELKIARSTLDKESYKQYVRDLRKEIKDQIAADYNKRKYFESFKRSKNKLYNKLIIERGKAYADVYIYTRMLLKPIEFNQDIQDQYDRINGVYEE